jgi:hypothetical protein
MNRFRLLFAVVLGLFVTLSSTAMADGMIHTGSSVRSKSYGFVNVNVYAIRHDMKERPASKSKQAVIDADVDKKFTWTMLRTVDSDKIQTALKEAFAKNGFGDGGRIGQFVGAFNQPELKEKSAVVISYNAGAKTTTIWVQNAGTATVAGQDFMKAVWSIWFGKIDQPSMGDQLISNL